MRKPVIKIDENIPFIKGRLEGEAEVEYLDQNAFSPQSVKDADGIIVRTRTHCGESLLKGSGVRFVATATIGTDHIDLPYCREKGIMVCNSPGCNAPGVAQYVWSSLLCLGFRPGMDRLGVIGYGNVGSIVGDWGERLNTEIWVSDPPKSRDAKREGKKLFDDSRSSLIREATLEEILEECEAVTLHTPLTKNGEYPTFHMIGERELALMKPGAILVNAARGSVTDSEALKKALRSGKIRAVIDTWENEPQLDNELLDLVNITTPHIAGYSRQGKERATRMVIEAANNYFGIKGDITGLTGAYMPPACLSAETILSSYNPMEDDMALRSAPTEFEKLRHNYNYRAETGN